MWALLTFWLVRSISCRVSHGDGLVPCRNQSPSWAVLAGGSPASCRTPKPPETIVHPLVSPDSKLGLLMLSAPVMPEGVVITQTTSPTWYDVCRLRLDEPSHSARRGAPRGVGGIVSPSPLYSSAGLYYWVAP